jgi:hypothetical protein
MMPDQLQGRRFPVYRRNLCWCGSIRPSIAMRRPFHQFVALPLREVGLKVLVDGHADFGQNVGRRIWTM